MSCCRRAAEHAGTSSTAGERKASGAAYRAALANVAKHALRRHGHGPAGRSNHLLIVVTDDGTGGADPSRGSGLRGLTDRIEALGGRLTVESPVCGGMRLRAEPPLGQPPAPRVPLVQPILVNGMLPKIVASKSWNPESVVTSTNFNVSPLTSQAAFQGVATCRRVPRVPSVTRPSDDVDAVVRGHATRAAFVSLILRLPSSNVTPTYLRVRPLSDRRDPPPAAPPSVSSIRVHAVGELTLGPGPGVVGAGCSSDRTERPSMGLAVPASSP